VYECRALLEVGAAGSKENIVRKSLVTFGDEKATTTFDFGGKSPFLKSICGLSCGSNGENSGPPPTRGMFVLETIDARFEADDFKLQEFESNENEVLFSVRAGSS
jgi:hypothetical protein